MKRLTAKLFAGLMLASLTALAVAQTPPVTPPAAEPKAAGDLRGSQEANAKLFKDLTRKLLELAVKLDKSEKPEDKDRAKTIRAALEVAEKAGADNQFRSLVAGMSGGTRQIQDIEKLIGQDEELTKTLLEMLTILMTDDETARLKAEIARLEKFLKEAEEIKRRTEINRTMTESKKGDPNKIGDNQKDLASQTKDLANRMGGTKGGEGKPQEPKSDPKATEPKDGEKAGESKSDSKDDKADSKDGEPKDGAEDKPMGGEPKPDDGKKGEPKESDAKPKPEGAKPDGQPNKSQGEGKGEPKPGKGQQGDGKGKGNPPKDSPASSKSGGGQPGEGGDSQPKPPNPNQTPGRKAVEEAYPHQKGAEDDARKDKRPDAAKKQDEAIKKIAEAIEEMKKRLKQLREEEMLKLLANLEARCNRMLAMQIEVYQNTKAIHDGIVKNDNQKSNADIQKSQQQADKEKEIVAEAEKALKLLETEGSAVAFALVLEEVKGDMIAVQLRLEKAYVDQDTQTIEENIIAMLKDMIQALKKQQQEMQNNKNNPNNNNGKPNQKLIDQLAELKLIRALQTQVNSRTTMYGKKSPGEQASDPIVQGELKQLAGRQIKLQDMIQKMATQANQ